jgi:hypothetical protein
MTDAGPDTVTRSSRAPAKKDAPTTPFSSRTACTSAVFDRTWKRVAAVRQGDAPGSTA